MLTLMIDSFHYFNEVSYCSFVDCFYWYVMIWMLGDYLLCYCHWMIRLMSHVDLGLCLCGLVRLRTFVFVFNIFIVSIVFVVVYPFVVV